MRSCAVRASGGGVVVVQVPVGRHVARLPRGRRVERGGDDERLQPELRAVGVDERDDLGGEVGAVARASSAAGVQSPAPAAAAGAAETAAALSSAASMGIVRRANRGARTGGRANVSAP